MKKLFVSILCGIILLGVTGCTSSNTKKQDSLVVNIFYQQDCTYCDKLFDFLDSLDDETKGKISIIKYDVDNQANSNLWEEVYNYFGDGSVGIPYTVINDQRVMGCNEEEVKSIINEQLGTNVNIVEKIKIDRGINAVGVEHKLSTNEGHSKGKMLYKISVEDFDYSTEQLSAYGETYTSRKDELTLKTKVSLILERKNNECYFVSQVSIDNGASTTIQGDCTYAINGNTLTVDGTYNRLDIPSEEEQSHGMIDHKSKEDSHLEFEIGNKGQYIKIGEMTYYNQTYKRILERKTDYLLVDEKNKLYDENGTEIYLSNPDDISQFNSINISDYDIKKVTELPNTD